eukprot:COSAG02_NODE_3801_length_6211_cov_6.100622_1_plen_389_part_00
MMPRERAGAEYMGLAGSGQLILYALVTLAFPAMPPAAVVNPDHHAQASVLFAGALDVIAQRSSEGAVAEAAIEGLLHSGSVLAQAGYNEAALQALDAVLRATPSPGQSAGRVASREHMLAMIQKLGTLRRRFAVLAADTPPGSDDDALGAPRWDPAMYWLDGVSQWEAQRGRVQRASGCTNALAAEAVQHLEQISIDIDVRRVRDCYVGFHGILIRHDSLQDGLVMLQLPAVPDSTAPLLTAWALGLLPADFQPHGTNWPFELPLAHTVSPKDFTGASITRQAARYMQDLQSGPRWSGFAAAGREELEIGMLWQSADELRHYENLTFALATQSNASPCDGKPQVIACSYWPSFHPFTHQVAATPANVHMTIWCRTQISAVVSPVGSFV